MAASREKPFCDKAIEIKFEERKVGKIMTIFVVSGTAITKKQKSVKRADKVFQFGYQHLDERVNRLDVVRQIIANKTKTFVLKNLAFKEIDYDIMQRRLLAAPMMRLHFILNQYNVVFSKV